MPGRTAATAPQANRVCLPDRVAWRAHDWLGAIMLRVGRQSIASAAAALVAELSLSMASAQSVSDSPRPHNWDSSLALFDSRVWLL
jgi:hypothetical protein